MCGSVWKCVIHVFESCLTTVVFSYKNSSLVFFLVFLKKKTVSKQK